MGSTCNNKEVLLQLEEIYERLEIIINRSALINSPEDFTHSAYGTEKLETICMNLVVIGEAVKTIDRITGKEFFIRYSSVHWNKMIGLRNIIVHQYCNVNAEVIFDIVKKNIPETIPVVRQMIEDLQNE